MKKRFFRRMVFISAAALCAAPLRPQTSEISGMLSAWISGRAAKAINPVLGFRYVPTLAFDKPLSSGTSLRFEAALNISGAAVFNSGENARTEGRVKLYRGWARFLAPRFEARLGLQKINFGSALLLRPLMWFDRIDARDPLQITDGVTGLLIKYTFQNNFGFWLWGLYGNTDVKGWESLPTAKKSLEYGGRAEIPVPKGEIGLTYHYRRADAGRDLSSLNTPATAVPERRYGIDGKWDLGIGLWFEAVLISPDSPDFPIKHQRAMTVGADYTFGVGNGLHVMAEHFLLHASRTAFGSSRGLEFTALSLNCPLGLLDNLTGMVYYDWENRLWYRFLSWQRKYDNWSFYLMGFWNPEEFRIYGDSAKGQYFGGKGFQIMAVFHH